MTDAEYRKQLRKYMVFVVVVLWGCAAGLSVAIIDLIEWHYFNPLLSTGLGITSCLVGMVASQAAITELERGRKI